MKTFVFVIVGIFCGALSMTCYGQTPHVDIHKGHETFSSEKKIVNNLNLSITNHESSPVWIWFSRTDESSMSDSLKVRRYFKLKPFYADFSYYQRMCDINVTCFVSTLFFSWAKVIPSKETFRMTFVDVGDSDEQGITTIITSHLNIVTEENVIRQCPGINDDYVKERFTYNPPSISIPWGSFVGNLSN